jgi:hypothetical protein
MAKAAAQIMPTTVHKLCTWHICQNFLKNLAGSRVQDALRLFHHMVYEADSTEAKFDERWQELVALFPSTKSRYLNALYASRHRWSRSLCPVAFDAGMTTSQRSEAFHSLIKGLVNKRTSLAELVETLLGEVAWKEDRKANETSLKSAMRARVLANPSQQLRRLAETLTDFALAKVLEADIASNEFLCILGTRTVKSVNDDAAETWTISDDLSCSCKQSTFMGLPCCHIIAYARANQAFELPPGVVLPRWHEAAPLRVLVQAPRALEVDGWVDASVDLIGDPEEQGHPSALQECHALCTSLHRDGMVEELLLLLRGLALRGARQRALDSIAGASRPASSPWTSPGCASLLDLCPCPCRLRLPRPTSPPWSSRERSSRTAWKYRILIASRSRRRAGPRSPC